MANSITKFPRSARRHGFPEFYGNATLVNGKLFPYLEVQPALYRFRVLNGSNAQFFNLSLSNGQLHCADRHRSGVASQRLLLRKAYSLAPANAPIWWWTSAATVVKQMMLNDESAQESCNFESHVAPHRAQPPCRLKLRSIAESGIGSRAHAPAHAQ